MSTSPFGGFPFGGLGGAMFSIIPVIVVVGFMAVIIMLIVRGVQGAQQWKRNNDSPVLTVAAAVVAKRADVSHYHHAGNDDFHHASSSTSYYVTFEVASGDRMEFRVRDTEYGLLAEQDAGRLTFQGTRYMGFERTRDGV